MAKNLLVGAACFFEGVGEDGKAMGVELSPGQDTLLVDGLGKGDHGRCPVDGFEGDGAEGVAEDVAEQRGGNGHVAFRRETP
jgi:hypothetical protein